jgi:sec-independent protein translocase protein TatA
MALETLTPLFIPGGLGPPELVVILLIFVLLFGANKIPKLARSTGEAMGEFQKGRQEVEDELEEMRDGASLDTDDEEFVDTEPVTSEETTSSGTTDTSGSTTEE